MRLPDKAFKYSEVVRKVFCRLQAAEDILDSLIKFFVSPFRPILLRKIGRNGDTKRILFGGASRRMKMTAPGLAGKPLQNFLSPHKAASNLYLFQGKIKKWGKADCLFPILTL
jgi:hypothetical protein